MTPTDAIVRDALAHAEQCQPMEACGVISSGQYIPLKNQATRNDAFQVDMHAYRDIDVASGVEAVVHSHVYLPPLASDGDRAGCESTGLPWLIVSWPKGDWTVIEPCGWRAPLVGRCWAWGTHDCYGLIRDGFQDYTGIRLPDFDRAWLWWENGGDMITEHFAETGFVRLPSDTAPQHCDIMGMKVAAKVVNHLGLFLAPDILLHQLWTRPSVKEVYGGIYHTATVLHLRHQRFLERPPDAR